MTASIKEVFGANVRLRRKEIKLQQNELAKRLSISQDALSRIENGHMGPRLDRLDEFAMALDCPISRLFQDLEQEKRPRSKTLDELVAEMPIEAQKVVLELVQYLASIRGQKKRLHPLRVELTRKEEAARKAARAEAAAKRAQERAEKEKAAQEKP